MPLNASKESVGGLKEPLMVPEAFSLESLQSEVLPRGTITPKCRDT